MKGSRRSRHTVAMTSPRIRLAVDGRPATAGAIRWTAERSRRTGAPIDIVSVAPDDEGPDEALRAVAAAREEVLGWTPDAVVATEVRRGSVVDVLIEVSASSDLLVVGSDRPRPLERFLHATLPMRLTGRVTCLLAVVPGEWDGRSGSTIAVGWDDDPAARVALDAAAEEARATGLPLHIHHVWRSVPVARYDEKGGAALTRAVEEDENLSLARVVRETEARYPGLVVAGELHRGSAGAGILGYASQAALIVVGSRRRSAVGEILAGATSDDLIAENSLVPLLVAPPPTGTE